MNIGIIEEWSADEAMRMANAVIADLEEQGAVVVDMRHSVCSESVYADPESTKVAMKHAVAIVFRPAPVENAGPAGNEEVG